MTITIKICIHLDNDENILKNKYLVFQGSGMLKCLCQNFFNTISAAWFFFRKIKKWLSEKWELSLALLFKEDLEILTGAID